MEDKLRENVKRMVEAGVPEAEIAKFIQTYSPKAESSKQVSIEQQAEKPGFFSRMYSKVTGKGKKREDVKDFSAGFDLPQPFRTGLGMLASTDEPQMIDVIRSKVPLAQFQKDEHGNTMVKVPGRDWEYVNQPGVSSRDIANFLGQAALFYGGGKVAGKIAPNSLPLRTGAVALTEGATSMGLDLASSASGSKQGINLPRAGFSAGLGALSELAAPVLSAAWRSMTKGGKKATAVEARKVLVEMGYSLDDISDEMVEAFIAKARQAADPRDAARLAEGQALPVKVPQTRGQITMSAKDQMFEDLAEKGAYGEGAETIMRGARQKTDEALRANVQAIQSKIGGGGVIRNEAGEAAQSELLKKYAAYRNKVGTAYEVARKSGGEAQDRIVGTMFDEISEAASDYMPHAKIAQIELDGLLKKIGEFSDNGEFIGFKDVDIKTLFDFRRRIGKLANAASDRTEATALTAIKKQFDRSVQAAMKTDLMSGDAYAIKTWKRAIALRRGQGKVFEAGDLVSELVDRKTGKLVVAPEAASNFIFGVSDTQLINRPQIARELKKLRNVLGETSDGWNAIREEAFLRLAKRGEKGAMAGGKYNFSGVNFKKAVDIIKENNKEVWETLFNQEERAMISRFANLSARLTNPVKGGSNTSNTAVGMSNIFQTITDSLFMGQKGRAFLSRIFPTVYEGLLLGPTAKAAKGAIPLRRIPPGVAGGLGAFAGSRLAPENETQILPPLDMSLIDLQNKSRLTR